MVITEKSTRFVERAKRLAPESVLVIPHTRYKLDADVNGQLVADIKLRGGNLRVAAEIVDDLRSVPTLNLAQQMLTIPALM